MSALPQPDYPTGNIIIKGEQPVAPEGTGPSETPLAEAALSELLEGRPGIRDMLKRVDGERPQWDHVDAYFAGADEMDEHTAALERAGREEADRGFAMATAREAEFRARPWWGNAVVVAGFSRPAPRGETVAPVTGQADARLAFTPMPGADEAVARQIAREEGGPAAGDPAATAVMPAAQAMTEIVPAVTDEDGGDGK